MDIDNQPVVLEHENSPIDIDICGLLRTMKIGLSSKGAKRRLAGCASFNRSQRRSHLRKFKVPLGRRSKLLKIKLILQQPRSESLWMRIPPSYPTAVRQLRNHRRRIPGRNFYTSRNTICISQGAPPLCSRLQ